MLSLAHDCARGCETTAAPTGVVLAQASLSDGESLPWLVADGRALPLREWAEHWPLGRVGSVTELVEQWSDHETDLRDLTAHPRVREVIASRGVDIGSLRVQAPIRPRQAFCTIGNYRRQIARGRHGCRRRRRRARRSGTPGGRTRGAGPPEPDGRALRVPDQPRAGRPTRRRAGYRARCRHPRLGGRDRGRHRRERPPGLRRATPRASSPATAWPTT